MKLIPVIHELSSANAKAIKLRCCKCQHMFPSTELMVDVQGRPFQAYYCNDCATAVQFDHNQAVINQSIEQEN